MERDGVLDGVSLDGFAQRDGGSKHLGFDVVRPLSFVRPDKPVLLDQLDYFRPAHRDGDDAVVAQNRGPALQSFLEREHLERIAKDRRVVHADNVVTPAGISPLGRRHEHPLLDLDVLLLEQVTEESFLLSDRVVSFVENPHVEDHLGQS